MRQGSGGGAAPFAASWAAYARAPTAFATVVGRSAAGASWVRERLIPVSEASSRSFASTSSGGASSHFAVSENPNCGRSPASYAGCALSSSRHQEMIACSRWYASAFGYYAESHGAPEVGEAVDGVEYLRELQEISEWLNE